MLCQVLEYDFFLILSEDDGGANTDETKSCVGGVDFVTLVIFYFMFRFLVVSSLEVLIET